MKEKIELLQTIEDVKKDVKNREIERHENILNSLLFFDYDNTSGFECAIIGVPCNVFDYWELNTILADKDARDEYTNEQNITVLNMIKKYFKYDYIKLYYDSYYGFRISTLSEKVREEL